jgi:hypothetical protein
LIGGFGVRQRASKARIVFLSIPPARWSSSAVSCAAASALVGNFPDIFSQEWGHQAVRLLAEFRFSGKAV